jgi:O-antigen/teichoic acid export membrane protein
VEDPPRRRALARLLHKSLVSMGAVFGFVCVVFAEPVVGFVYGLDSYGEAVPVLRVFGIIVLVRHACEASGLLLTTSRRQHVRLGVVACAVVLNAGLNAFAIPAYGIAGAAAVALVTNVLVSAGYIVAAWRENSGWFFEARTYAPLIVAGLLGCGLWFGGMTRHLALLPPAVLLLGAAVLYLGFSPADRHVVFSRGGIGRAADRVTRGPAH